MRVSRWLLGVSAVAAMAAGGVTAGCSSSSSSAPTGMDASTESDAAEGGGEASCYVDASLTAFAQSDAAAASCATCVNTQCMTEIRACSTSCPCISLFTCLADAGVGAGSQAAVGACVPPGFTSAQALLNDPGISAVYTCFTVTCSDACSAVAPDDGGDAGTPADGDAGIPADASGG